MLKRLIYLFVIGLLIPFICFTVPSYSVAPGTFQIINEWGYCRKVTNNGTNTIFIPTNTLNEWGSFITYPPATVFVDACCGKTC